MKPLTENDIRSILHLLDDDSDKVVALVGEQLAVYDPADLKRLEQAAANASTRAHWRVQQFLRQLVVDDEAALAALPLGPDGDIDIEAGAYFLARTAYPDLDQAHYARLLDDLGDAGRELIAKVHSPVEAVKQINKLLFEEEGFRGNQTNYYDPENSYINRVLDRRLGIPISLSAVYMLVARRAGLPIAGVGLPGHFIVKVKGSRDLYLDPCNQGQILSRADCVAFLQKAGYGFQESFLAEVSGRDMLARMIRNLVYIYGKQDRPKEVERLRRVLSALRPA